MPYTKKQKRLFFAASKDPEVAKKVSMTQKEAKNLADEAAKTPTKKVK
jgi:hypothetical protein